jgi:oligoribonuclease NrnB/cAMP/cGMP phosphodiesterase (DHH superfamily)
MKYVSLCFVCGLIGEDISTRCSNTISEIMNDVIVVVLLCFTFSFKQSKSKNDVSGDAELEWATNGGGKLTASGKANYESAQNFRIEVDVDSPALKLNKWHVLLVNKPSKSAKTLQITVTEAGASVINGR